MNIFVTLFRLNLDRKHVDNNWTVMRRHYGESRQWHLPWRGGFAEFVNITLLKYRSSTILLRCMTHVTETRRNAWTWNVHRRHYVSVSQSALFSRLPTTGDAQTSQWRIKTPVYTRKCDQALNTTANIEILYTVSTLMAIPVARRHCLRRSSFYRFTREKRYPLFRTTWCTTYRV